MSDICKHCGRPIYPIPEQRGYQHEPGIGVFCPPTLEGGHIVQARFAEPLREPDHVCEHGTAMDVHCCHCHSGFIFDKDHVCPERGPEPLTWEERARATARELAAMTAERDEACIALQRATDEKLSKNDFALDCAQGYRRIKQLIASDANHAALREGLGHLPAAGIVLGGEEYVMRSDVSALLARTKEPA